MFLICRKQPGSQKISPLCQGDCEAFVKYYIKYNIPLQGLHEYTVYKAEEQDMGLFVDPKSEEEIAAELETARGVPAGSEGKKPCSGCGH